MSGLPTHLSLAEIARHFHVAPRTVSDWKQRGCPLTSLAEIAEWRAANLRQEHLSAEKREEITGSTAVPNRPAGPTLQEKRLKADTKKIEADVELKQLSLSLKRGDLVERDDIEREVCELVIRVKERLIAMPDEFETRFPAEIRATLKEDMVEWIRQLLLEMSRWEVAGGSMDEMILRAAGRIRKQREPGQPVGSV